MAQQSTVFGFDLSVSDVDRGVYETLHLQVARHPSETDEYMLTRVLAYALEFEEGIGFGGGLSTADDPAVWVHDLTGQLRAWIEVGTPAAERLHKASKACDRVAVYCHKDVEHYLRTLVGAKVYAPDKVTIWAVDRGFVAAAVARLQKRTKLEISRTEGDLYVDVGGETLTTAVVRHPLP